jgi:transposase InsO family protein
MTTEILPTRSTLEASARPDPEVLARPKRRRFTAEYRMSIVREADACTRKGELVSRYVVGWMLAHGETAVLAERFIAETLAKHGITRDQLTIHADRGPAMTSKPVAFLMADLGVTKSHSRPHVSNDNPFSESCTRRRRCITDSPLVSVSSASPSLPAPTPPIPNASLRVIPQPPLLPTAVWINPPALEVPKVQ